MSLSSENGPALTMPVAPAYGGYGGGMGGFGGDGWWGILFLIAILCGGWGGFGGFGGMGGMMGMWPWMFGGFGNGFGGGSAAAQGALTREQACIDNNFNNLGRTVEGIASAVNQGFQTVDTRICQQQYDTAQQINGVNMNMMQGFNAANVVALQGQNAAQAQMADCCCKLHTGQMQIGNQIERASCDTNYNAATNTAAIIQNAHSDADRIIARFDAFERNQDKETIASLRQQLQDARFQASQVAQNGTIQSMVNASTAEILHRTGHDCPSAAYIVQPPTPVTFQTNGYGQAVFNGNCGYNGFSNGYGGCGGCCNG